jgi:hypothetical protein
LLFICWVRGFFVDAFFVPISQILVTLMMEALGDNMAENGNWPATSSKRTPYRFCEGLFKSSDPDTRPLTDGHARHLYGMLF